jgi:hypothetical protein
LVKVYQLHPLQRICNPLAKVYQQIANLLERQLMKVYRQIAILLERDGCNSAGSVFWSASTGMNKLK